MSILITGASGFVGQQLLGHLANEEVLVTSRDPEKARSKLGPGIAGAIGWEPTRESLSIPTGTRIRAAVNLMGESIAEGRWTSAKKERIRNSRVEGTRRLVNSLLQLNPLPEVLVSASAVGIYADGGDRVIDEAGPHAEGFLADVCEAWERATDPLAAAGVRVVKIRIGIVLGMQGGALEKLVPLFRWGLGGNLGNGKQYVPWIHVDDLARLIGWSLTESEVRGVLNGTAPNPVTNAEWTRQLARATGRIALLPVPQFALRMALGEFANSLFVSHRVIPKRALDLGFDFRFNQFDEALKDLI